MTRIHIEHLYRIDLDECITEYALSEPLMHQDARADVFTAALRRGMTPVDLTGAKATAYITFAATGQTLTLPGTIDSSTASVTFDEDCYAVPGGFRMALQIVQGDTRRTVLTVTGEIRRTATDCVITGTEVVPTLPELLEQIDATRQAATAANSAADEAILASLEARAATAGHSLSSAPPIVCSAAGAIVTVPDAAQGRALPALSLMGKTWQGGTPTPSAPVELESIPAGTVTAHVAGLNLLRWEALTVPEATTIADDGSITVINDSASKTYYPRTAGFYLPAGTFTLSVSRQYTSAMLYFRPEGSATPDSIARITGSTSATFTIEAGWYEIMFTVDPGTSETLYIQLQPGSAATAYEPPIPDAAAVTLTDCLRGIPVASGGNYTDENGQQWICDEIDLTRGKLVRRVAKVDNTGFRWARSTDTHAQFNINPFTSNYLRTRDKVTTMASHVPAISNSQSGGAAEPARGTHFSLYSGSGNNIAYLILPLETASTQSELEAWLAAQEAAGTPVEFLYALADPIETDLSADEVNAFLQLRSPYGSMSVYNDKAAGQIVRYVADTKLYIDRKMAAILPA